MFDGSQSIPIGAGKIDETFFKDLDQASYPRVWGSADPINERPERRHDGAGRVGRCEPAAAIAEVDREDPGGCQGITWRWLFWRSSNEISQASLG